MRATRTLMPDTAAGGAPTLWTPKLENPPKLKTPSNQLHNPLKPRVRAQGAPDALLVAECDNLERRGQSRSCALGTHNLTSRIP